MIRLERRLNVPRWLPAAMPLVSFAAGLVLAAAVLVVTGHDPIATYAEMFRAGFTDPGAMSATLLNATPILLAALCLLVTVRMRLYNIGGEGQLYMGAMGAAAAGVALAGQSRPVVMLAMVAAGCLCGALWAGVPGLLRAYLNTNEILTTLMLNYVAGLFIAYLIFSSHSYWRDLSSETAKFFPQGKVIEQADWWPILHVGGVNVPFGFVLGLVLVAAISWTLHATRMGFRVRVIAGSPSAARYAGIDTKRAIVAVMAVSGGLAGLAGASMVGDFTHMLDPNGLQQAQFGYAGIVAAALVSFSPVASVAAAIFVGALTNAGFQLQGATFPQGLVGVTEGIILLCVLGAQFLAVYRMRWQPRRAGAAPGTSEVEAEPAKPSRPQTGTELEAVVEP